MAELDNLLNSPISLITHLDLRYDGILFSINTNESSIVLKEGWAVSIFYFYILFYVI
jgi:hypothetical protein